MYILRSLFTVLVAAGLVITGASCAGTSVSSDNPSANRPAAPKKSSEYPPIASAVAQSDLKNLDGTTFKIADRKGKVLLLNMWATWCGPCRSEMPTLVKMQDQHRDAGLEVIGINTDDETVQQINDFVAEMNLNYQIVWATRSCRPRF